MTKLQVKYLDNYDLAVGPLEYKNPGDSGFDLRWMPETPEFRVSAEVEGWFIPHGKVVLLKTGIKTQFSRGWELQIRPRSGMVMKQGITVANSPGTIDSGYRGEIGVLVTCLNKGGSCIMPGDRIAQAVMVAVEKAEIEEIKEVNETERGEGGFGSTGVM